MIIAYGNLGLLFVPKRKSHLAVFNGGEERMKLLRGAKMMKPQETPQAGTRERTVFKSHTKKL